MPDLRRHPRSAFSRLAGPALGLFASGCGHTQHAGPVATPAVAPAAAASIAGAVVIPADAGATLIQWPSAPSPPPASVRLRVGAGPDQPAPVWYLAPAPSTASPAPADSTLLTRARRWLGPPVTWQAVPAGPAVQTAPPGLTLISLPPAAGVAGGEIRINGEPHPVRWIAPPAGAPDLGPLQPADAGRDLLLAALAPARNNPWSLWRAALIEPSLAAPAAGGAGPLAAPDSVALRLGLQHGAVWNLALNRLAVADRDTAQRLARRLAGVVDFSYARALPVWTDWPGPLAPADGLDLLLADLIAPDLNEADRVARSRAYLDTLPTGAAVVLDDAGLREQAPATAAPSRALTTIALINLSDRPAAGSVLAESAATPLEMLTIPPMTAATVRVPADAESASPTSATPARRLELRIGPWHGRAAVIASPIPARPPGVPIGPLALDLTMPQLAAAARTGEVPGVAPVPEGATVGSVLRSPRGGNWVVFLECHTPPGTDAATDADRGEVSVHFGAPSAAAPVWRIPLGGEARLERLVSANAVEVIQSRNADRWSMWVPIPREAIEPDGTVRLGITRRRPLPDGSTERTAWPRPLLPWQEEPGRITIDLKAWESPAATP